MGPARAAHPAQMGRQASTSAQAAPVADPSGAALPVAVVARRLGVAPATLRTWARRYDLGPTQHAPGSHRRYGPTDVARLEHMMRLLREGVPPADAARAVQTGAYDEAHRPDASAAPAGGGRVLALPDADPATRGLGRAALALDAPTVTGIVREQLETRGLVATWDTVLRPVLVAVGDRWAATGDGVEVEHLLAACVSLALQEWGAAHGEPTSSRAVLLAGAPGEQHALPLHAVGAGLAARQVRTSLLGPDMPISAVTAAVRRTGPSVLFVWAQRRPTAQAARELSLPAQRPPTALVVGGPGWVDAELPAGARFVEDLQEALTEVCALAL